MSKLKLISLFVLLLVIGFGSYYLSRVYLSRVRGNVLGQAVPIEVSLSPEQASLPPNLPVSVTIDAKTNKLAFVRLVILFDNTKVQLATEATVNPVFGTLISKSSMEEANTQGKLTVAAAVTSGTTPPSGIISDIVVFELSSLSETPNDQVQLSFDTNDMQFVESEGVSEVAVIPNSTLYTLNPVATPTPTPTESPSPTPSPTPTPTPTPTLPPTPTPTVAPTATPIDTVPPTVNITSPTNGAIVPKGLPILIQATATDNVGVTRVEFLAAGKVRCTDTVAPYECSWTLPTNPNVVYILQAKAYDARNNMGTNQISITSSN